VSFLQHGLARVSCGSKPTQRHSMLTESNDRERLPSILWDGWFEGGLPGWCSTPQWGTGVKTSQCESHPWECQKLGQSAQRIAWGLCAPTGHGVHPAFGRRAQSTTQWLVPIRSHRRLGSVRTRLAAARLDPNRRFSTARPASSTGTFSGDLA
jgi:hypothetical protein